MYKCYEIVMNMHGPATTIYKHSHHLFCSKQCGPIMALGGKAGSVGSLAQVILRGKLLGMPVAVKLPLANASLSLPDLANEFLDKQISGDFRLENLEQVVDH